MIVERTLRIGRLLERESFRYFDVEGTGLDQAINFLKRRILILSVILNVAKMPSGVNISAVRALILI